MTKTAANAARSGIRLGKLTVKIQETATNVTSITELAGQLNKSIHEASTFAKTSSQEADRIKSLVRDNAVKSEQASKAAQEMQLKMHETFNRLNSLMEKIKNISEVSKVVEGIALETKLLAFNASIEAARAGDHGHGFRAVANHIQELALNTSLQTKQIFELLTVISAELEPSRQAIQENNALAVVTSERTQEVQNTFVEIAGLINSTVESISRIAVSSQQQQGSVDVISDKLKSTDQATQMVLHETSKVNSDTFALTEMVEEAYVQFGKIDTQTPFHSYLAWGRGLALTCENIFEKTIVSGQLNLSQILDLKYTEIKGPMISSLGRLFDISKVPSSGFEPPKYTTAYDQLIDQELQVYLDEVKAKDSKLVFAILLDLNAYAPVHNKDFCKDWTGIAEKDLAGNRLKRFFLDNNVLVRGARVGLSSAAVQLPHKSDRQSFESHAQGTLSAKSDSRMPYLVQTYARDTGAVLTALTIPVFVRDQRFGAILMGWNVDA
jgi:methyl-accepting chemotaxis protein